VPEAHDPYEPPHTEDDEPSQLTKGDEVDGGAAVGKGAFYSVPLPQLLAFGLIGANLYVGYWMYRCWSAYAAAWGYSRRGFWRRVDRATGYRVNPFWRAVLGSFYCLALFPAIQRECRQSRVRALPFPMLLGWVLNVLAVAHASPTSLVVRLALSPVWALVLVQLAINRLSTKRGVRPRFRTTAIELLFVTLGGLLTWR